MLEIVLEAPLPCKDCGEAILSWASSAAILLFNILVLASTLGSIGGCDTLEVSVFTRKGASSDSFRVLDRVCIILSVGINKRIKDKEVQRKLE